MSTFAPVNIFDQPRYYILGEIMSKRAWELLFLCAGVIQLYGLYQRSKWLRLIGATMIFSSLLCVLQSILISAPWQFGVAMYVACIFTELCAIIFQTACIIRMRDYPRWFGQWMSKL